MLSEDSLKKFNVMFATPCYISSVSMNYTTSMFTLSNAVAHVGMNCALFMHSESLITRARNRMVSDFISKNQYTHLFFIDSDIRFSPQSVFRLLLSDHDISAGIYPLKKIIWPEDGLPRNMALSDYFEAYTEYAFNPVCPGKPMADLVDEDGFVEVSEASTGFFCIKRDVFMKMINAYPQLRYSHDFEVGKTERPQIWNFFDCFVDPNSKRYLSEDYAFCKLWRDIGGKIWASIDCELGHLGQHEFNGTFGKSMKVRGLL